MRPGRPHAARTPGGPPFSWKERIMARNDHAGKGPAAARVHGAPGERTRFAGVFRALWPLCCAMFVAGVLVGAVLPRFNVPLAGLPLLVAALVAFALALGPARKRINAFFDGARGEEAVGAELSRLPGGYEVFHGVDLGTTDAEMRRGSDIDHVVVGPCGVCVIETKTWNGAVTLEDGHILVNGARPSRPPVVQARQAAGQLAEWLAGQGLPGIPVRPIVCFAGGGGSGLDSRVDEVAVCGLPRLLDTLRAAAEAAPGRERIDRIAALLAPRVHM